MPLALGLEAKLLDELGPFHGRARVRGQSLEKSQVVVVERVEALVAVERDEGPEGSLAAGERHDHSAPEFTEERVGVRFTLVASAGAQEQARLLTGDGPGDHRRDVDDRSFDR